MAEVIERINYKGYTINICYDEFPESPREWDNLTTMVCLHHRYHLACEIDINADEFNSWGEVKGYILKNYKPVIINGLYLYDHSSVSLSMSPPIADPQGWDTSFVGYVFVTRESVRDFYGYKCITKNIKKKIEEAMQYEVEVYSYYLNGEVYGFIIEDEKGNNIDSLWGFYGYDWDKNGLLESAYDVIEDDIQQKSKRRMEKLKILIRNHVPLDKRVKVLQGIA